MYFEAHEAIRKVRVANGGKLYVAILHVVIFHSSTPATRRPYFLSPSALRSCFGGMHEKLIVSYVFVDVVHCVVYIQCFTSYQCVAKGK